MKTSRFIAMLLAAFTLSFTLTACGGDDDDEPRPDTPNVTTSANELKIGNEKSNFTYGYFSEDDDYVELWLTNGNDDKYSDLYITIFNTQLSNEKLPTGTFPIKEWSEALHSDSKCCYIEGWLNLRYKDGGMPIAGTSFEAVKGSGSVKIERNGDNYTVTIDKMVLDCEDEATDENSTVTTSFTYKGKLYYDEAED